MADNEKSNLKVKDGSVSVERKKQTNTWAVFQLVHCFNNTCYFECMREFVLKGVWLHKSTDEGPNRRTRGGSKTAIFTQ